MKSSPLSQIISAVDALNLEGARSPISSHFPDKLKQMLDDFTPRHEADYCTLTREVYGIDRDPHYADILSLPISWRARYLFTVASAIQIEAIVKKLSHDECAYLRDNISLIDRKNSNYSGRIWALNDIGAALQKRE